MKALAALAKSTESSNTIRLDAGVTTWVDHAAPPNEHFLLSKL